jgi:thiosulfate/3-mercaptopyruvate sulfurtransferase
MRNFRRLTVLTLAAALVAVLLGACGPTYDQSGKQIISAKQASAMLAEGVAVLVDARNADEYAKEHVAKAVCIARDDIMVNTPYPNLVADKAQIEQTLGNRGIGNASQVIIYDANQNMDAARLWWTMVAYGHDAGKVMVVSGGLDALKSAGAALESGMPTIQPVVYTAKDLNPAVLATKAEVEAQVNNPDPKTVIVDTRTDEEFAAGTIPGSIHINFTRNNFFKGGAYRPVSQIRAIYIEKEIDPSKTVILFCKTSIRGAESFLALYNAGYRNLKLYDGAWVEWSGNASVPVQAPATTDLPVLNTQDGS